MNSAPLIGRLATDVDVKEVKGGPKVTSVILAVDRNAEEAGLAILQQPPPAVHAAGPTQPCERHSRVPSGLHSPARQQIGGVRKG